MDYIDNFHKGSKEYIKRKTTDLEATYYIQTERSPLVYGILYLQNQKVWFAHVFYTKYFYDSAENKTI